jgi:polyhydroxybutyrate depolymerase
VAHTGGVEGAEVILYGVEGGGHAWPGGSQYLPESVIGKVSHDIDATQLVWDFFKTHARN